MTVARSDPRRRPSCPPQQHSQGSPPAASPARPLSSSAEARASVWKPARQARTAGAELILTGRNPDRLDQAGEEVAAVSTATLDLGDAAALERFFTGLPGQIDHVLVTGGGPRSRLGSSTRRCRRGSWGDGLDRRRSELRATLPIRRVVGALDVAAGAILLMTNTAVTGATFDVDGGQQLIP
jgi:NAD(P)-dependent dehydrogenase (short-subunit alcohol dehydrogenase family)